VTKHSVGSTEPALPSVIAAD